VIARFGEFTLDSGRRQLLRDDREVHLTPKAFDLLTLLVEAAPHVVSKSELHRRLWPDTFVEDTTLVGLVKELRRALDDRDPGAPWLRTAHRIGYAFGRDVELLHRRVEGSRVARWVVLATRTVELVHGENLIGRHPASVVSVDAAGVSRRHARIVVEDDAARLEDLGSKNGTRLGATRVHGPVALRDGDRIQIGPVAIVYRESQEGASTQTIVLQP
jgi:DNA-binding winged helix-turn-helix (wHTH) protein